MTKMIFGPLRTAHNRSDRLLKMMTGLATSDFMVLATIEENPKAKKKDISELSSTDPASCGKIISGFRQKGWVKVAKGTKNTSHVTITPQGVAKLSDVRLSAIAVEQSVIKDLGANLLPQAIRVLDAITRRTEAALEECR